MEEALRQLQIAFIGRVLAGVSHDLNNHLAIVNESNGLLDDLVRVSGPSAAARMRKITATIEGRIVQAAELCRHLHSFSHRLNEPQTSFDVNELLREELALLERLVRTRRVRLKSRLQEGVPLIFNNPALLQLVFFTLFGSALNELGKDDSLIIFTEGQERGVKIAIHSPVAPFVTAGLIDLLPYAVAKLAAEKSTRCLDNGWTETTLIVPSLQAAISGLDPSEE